MSLTEDKKRVLEELWKASPPLRPEELSDRLDFTLPTLMMHLVGLKKLGYIDCPTEGYYAMTEKGKEALGFPPLTQQLARNLLSRLPNEKTFYFFTGIGNYSGVSASSLEDFCEKARTIDLQSVEFHTKRGDFENWLNGLGDVELAKKMSLLKKQNLTGEELRQAVCRTVKDRYEEIRTVPE
jgi:hypothetical protein